MIFLFITCCNVFNVWPRTNLLPVWPRDAKRLDTPIWFCNRVVTLPCWALVPFLGGLADTGHRQWYGAKSMHMSETSIGDERIPGR